MASSVENNDKKSIIAWIHVAIVFILMFGIAKLPPPAPITVQGMQSLGIFVGMVYGWITCGTIWPSFLGFIMMVATDLTTPAEALAAGLGGTVGMYLMFIFVFAYQITYTGLDRYIATWCITRKFLSGKPWVFSGTILIASMVTTAITQNPFAVIPIFWSVMYSICDQLGYKKYDAYPSIMLIGIVLGASIGGCTMPFSALVVILNGITTTMTGLTIDPLKWLLFSAPICTIVILVYVLVAKFIFRPDISLLKNFSVDMIDASQLKMTKQMRYTAFMLILFVLALLAPSVLPAGSVLQILLKKLGNIGITLFVLMICCIIKIDGQPFLDFNKCARNGVPWGVLGMILAVLPIGNIMTSDAMGIKAYLMQFFTSIFSGMGSVVFVMVCTILTIILTNLINDAVAGMLFIAIAASCASAFGFNVIQVAAMVIVGSHIALLLPSSSPYAAMMHGNTEWLKAGTIYKYCAISMIIIMLTVTFGGFVWVNIVMP